ncbi:MAG TPA: hydroxyacylglutathione hydrolase [SAR86 cluster bacterium]|nr:hydroxyacylglutathione hydrolase [SAR86 cluster bacterium]HJM59052.1 hydroxyacylglutathione hydrolase [SAR86 cluster bacterium]|tara:strand:- start:6448 stop:7221 length:774 start_codon:yes stop_codon:yes gene_type:complete
MFEILPIRAFSDNYIWALIKDGEVIVVDPGEAKPVLETINKLNLDLKGIIITHHHFDHTGGIQELKDHFHCDVYGPGGDHIQGISSPLNDNEEFELLGKKFIALSTPGHTLDQLAYYSDEACSEPILFCGDTLFSAGCGRIFEGTPLQMHESLSRFSTLPGNTKVYCGHEYTQSNLTFAITLEPDNQFIKDKIEEVNKLRELDKETLPSDLASELKINPFMRCEEKTVIDAASNFVGSELKEPHEVLGAIRDWKDNF